MNALPSALIADVIVPLAAVEATRAQAALFESFVRSRTGTSHYARASRSAPCRRARRDRRAAPASRKHNPRLRLREVSKGRKLVEIVVARHDTPPFGWTKLVRAAGFEPATAWFQARSAAGLRHALKLDHPAGLEPATSRSATGCSAPTELWMDLAPEVGFEPALNG